jgi:O-antigen ligase
MQQLVDQGWFPLADLALAGGGVVLCYLWPQLGGWPLLLALLPWFGRALGGRFPFQRTVLDIPLFIFLITAFVGAWAAYSQQAALAKLWILIGAILLYYALAGQPEGNLWTMAGGLSILGALVAAYFMATADWKALPADLALLNRLGIASMSVRPALALPGLHPNQAGGLIAIIIPFSLALGLIARRKTGWQLAVLALATGGLSLLGLLFSSSRAAWLALFVALGIWALWAGILHYKEKLPKSWLVTAVVFITFAMLAVIGWIVVRPTSIARIVNLLPGPDSTITRMEIYTNSLRLVRDTPFTGGGLGSFSGLYSSYIMLIPNSLYDYSHNLYLDIILEQGFLGLASFLLILGGSLWLVARGGRNTLLRGATLAGLVAMALHGLADDPLYGVRGTPLLFVLPGLAAAIDLSEFRRAEARVARQRYTMWAVIGILGGVLLLGGYLARSIWLGQWYADQGTLAMARVELSDFPSGKWDEGQDLPALAPAEALFESALQDDRYNLTAHYRLGLITMLRRDFPAAQSQLEAAFILDSGHRGVRKALGYCYVWLGMYDRAANMLQAIPEAKQELAVYAWWWASQNRPDLAQRADQMVKAMN